MKKNYLTSVNKIGNGVFPGEKKIRAKSTFCNITADISTEGGESPLF